MAFQGEVAFQAEMASALLSSVCIPEVEMHLYLSISRVSADSLHCNLGKEGIRRFDFDEVLPGVLLSQPSPFHALETQHPASSFLRLRCAVS